MAEKKDMAAVAARPVDRSPRSESADRATGSAPRGLVVDHHDTVVAWGPGAEHMLGYPASAIIGLPVATLLAEPDSPSPPAPRERYPRWHGHVRMRHRDGHSVLVRVISHERDDHGGGPCSEWLVMPPFDEAGSPWVDEAWLSTAFASAFCGTAIYDSDCRLRFANAPMEEAFGMTLAEMRGLRPSEIVPSPHLKATDETIRRVLLTGRPEHRQNFFRTPGRDRKQSWSVSLTPLTDSRGVVYAVCLTGHDETEQYWARRRLTMLNEAAARIGSSLDIGTTAQELADVAVRGLADVVSVDLRDYLDDARRELTATVEAGPVDLRHMAYATVPSGPAAPWAPGSVRTVSEGSAEARCLRRGSTVSSRAPMPSQGDGGASSGAVLHWLVVPMHARGKALGTVSFGRLRDDEAFVDDDRLLAEEITGRASVCIDNAGRYTRERGTALALQRSLLPRRLPRSAAIEAASRYRPSGDRAGVGGDWFDVIPLSGARVALVVGDVVGHGIQASATMGRLRTAVRTLANVDLPPDELLTHLDDLVTHLANDPFDTARRGGAEDSESPGELGATCLYAVYDPVTRRCTLARAGHPPPLVLGPDRTTSLIDVPAGPPLGLGGLPFESVEVTLPEDSLLALYTDGLIEGRDRDIDVGLGKLRRVLAESTGSLDDVCDQVLRTMLPHRPDDDVALLLARPHGLDGSQVAAWEIPEDPAAVGTARENVARQLAAWGLEDLAFTTELVASELVTNAIRYGRPPIHLRLIHDRTLICEVSDSSSSAPHLRRAHTYDEGGRGLLLIAQFTQAWGSRYTPTGKIIWAEQTLDEANGGA